MSAPPPWITPKTKTKGRRENEVLAGVLAYLSLRQDCWCWRQNTSAGVARSGAYMRSGVRGTPDILCIHTISIPFATGIGSTHVGRLVGVEVKRELGGKVSSEQERWGETVESYGGLYIVARDVAAVERALGPELVRVVKRPLRSYPR